MARLTHDGARFVFQCVFAERKLAERSGMKWSKKDRLWYTTDLAVAAKLRVFATRKVRRGPLRCLIEVTPWPKPLPPSPPGLRLKKHQREAALFALERNSCYLRLEPGLGKTVVAATVAVARGGSVLYVTPPSMAANVEYEFQRWAPGLRVHRIEPEHRKDRFRLPKGPVDVLIMPDSLLGKPRPIAAAVFFAAIGGKTTIIVDEAHRYKTSLALRSMALFHIARFYEYQIYMSGTPLPNRPMELFTVLSHAAPETIDFRNEFRYGVRYCAGFKTRWGWKFTGASNMAELKRKVIAPSGLFMLKQTKEVLGLPPKTESVLVIGDKLKGEVARLDRAARHQYGDCVDELIEKRLAAKIGREEIPMATYRRLLGVAKVLPIARHVTTLLQDDETLSILVFVQHREVVEKLVAALSQFKPYVITGATPMKDRKRQVDEFQKSKKRRLFIGNITAMGEGNTLTKARYVLIGEPDWVPGKNTQAGDRAHRIGQNFPVHVEYAVYRNSLDKIVIENVLSKRQAISFF